MFTLYPLFLYPKIGYSYRSKGAAVRRAPLDFRNSRKGSGSDIRMRQTLLLLSALILASCGGDKGTGPTTESTGPKPVASVQVTPDTHILTAINATQQFEAGARDAAGATISGKSFTWVSSSPPVVLRPPKLVHF